MSACSFRGGRRRSTSPPRRWPCATFTSATVSAPPTIAVTATSAFWRCSRWKSWEPSIAARPCGEGASISSACVSSLFDNRPYLRLYRDLETRARAGGREDVADAIAACLRRSRRMKPVMAALAWGRIAAGHRAHLEAVVSTDCRRSPCGEGNRLTKPGGTRPELRRTVGALVALVAGFAVGTLVHRSGDPALAARRRRGRRDRPALGRGPQDDGASAGHRPDAPGDRRREAGQVDRGPRHPGARPVPDDARRSLVSDARDRNADSGLLRGRSRGRGVFSHADVGAGAPGRLRGRSGDVGGGLARRSGSDQRVLGRRTGRDPADPAVHRSLRAGRETPRRGRITTFCTVSSRGSRGR